MEASVDRIARNTTGNEKSRVFFVNDSRGPEELRSVLTFYPIKSIRKKDVKLISLHTDYLSIYLWGLSVNDADIII